MAERPARPTERVSGTMSDDTREAERRRRRAKFLGELKEASVLRARLRPRRARAARLRQQLRMRALRC